MFSAGKQGDRWQTQLNLARDSLGRGGVRSVCICLHCLFVCSFYRLACVQIFLLHFAAAPVGGIFTQRGPPCAVAPPWCY